MTTWPFIRDLLCINNFYFGFPFCLPGFMVHEMRQLMSSLHVYVWLSLPWYLDNLNFALATHSQKSSW